MKGSDARRGGSSFLLTPDFWILDAAFISSLIPHPFVAASSEKAGAAEDRAALRWIEGNGCLLPALRALNGNFNPLANA